MHGHKPFPIIANERQQIGALSRRQIDLSDSEEQNGIEVVEVPGEELFAGCDAGSGLEEDGLLRDRRGRRPDAGGRCSWWCRNGSGRVDADNLYLSAVLASGSSSILYAFDRRRKLLQPPVQLAEDVLPLVRVQRDRHRLWGR
jgi:hypothetical protein